MDKKRFINALFLVNTRKNEGRMYYETGIDYSGCSNYCSS